MKHLMLLILLTVAILLSSSRAQPASTEIKKLIAHALFYMSQNGRRAEAVCYMRQAQRMHDSVFQPLIKSWYKKFGIDDKRVVLSRLLEFTGRISDEPDFAKLKDPLGATMAAFVEEGMPQAPESAMNLLKSVKNARGESDLMYAEVLEFVGDSYVLQHQHTNAAKAFARVLEIRRSARPLLERYLGIERSSSRGELSAKKDLRRIMSKLADTYWVIGHHSAAAALRNDPKTSEGDIYRVVDIETVDQLLVNRAAIHQKHPSCVENLLKGTAYEWLIRPSLHRRPDER